MIPVDAFVDKALGQLLSDLNTARENIGYAAGHLAGYSKGPQGLDAALASLTGKWKGAAADAFADRVKTVSDFGVWAAAMLDRTIDQHGWRPIPADKQDFAQALGHLIDIYTKAQADFAAFDRCYPDWCGKWINMVLRQAYQTAILPNIPQHGGGSAPKPFRLNVPTLWEYAANPNPDPNTGFNVQFNHDWLGNVSGVQTLKDPKAAGHGVVTVAYVSGGVTRSANRSSYTPPVTVRLFYQEPDITGTIIDPLDLPPIDVSHWSEGLGNTAAADTTNQGTIHDRWQTLIRNRYRQFHIHQLGSALNGATGPAFPAPRDSSALPKGKDSSTGNSYGGGGGGGDLGLPPGGGFSPNTGMPPLNGSSLGANTDPYGNSGLSPYSPDSYKPGSLTDPYGESLGHGGDLGGTGLGGYDPHGFGGDGASLAGYDPHAGAGLGGLNGGVDMGGAGAGSGLGAGGSLGSSGGAGAGAAGTAGRAMPMMPAGAGSGAGKDDKGRNRNAYLQEDESVWGADGDAGDGVL